MLEPWFKLPELLDRAASTHSRMDGVASHAQPLVVGLQVETRPEVERGAIFVKLGANPASVGKHEVDLVDLVLAGKDRTADRACRNAFRPFVLYPFDLREVWTRLHGDAKDHLVLDHQASHGLADGTRLHCGKAEQRRKQAQKNRRSHLPAHPHSLRALQRRVEQAMNYPQGAMAAA